jgi:hypothetical protein
MRVALAVVILGGLLYLEALRGWTRHRAEQFRLALRELAWSSRALVRSTDRLAGQIAASQHAWGNAVDLVVRAHEREPWHFHVEVDPK